MTWQEELTPEDRAEMDRILGRTLGYSEERDFIRFVAAHKGIGYGRMMQLISHLWWQTDPGGAHLANTAFGLLPPEERAAYEALAAQDAPWIKRTLQEQRCPCACHRYPGTYPTSQARPCWVCGHWEGQTDANSG